MSLNGFSPIKKFNTKEIKINSVRSYERTKQDIRADKSNI